MYTLQIQSRIRKCEICPINMFLKLCGLRRAFQSRLAVNRGEARPSEHCQRTGPPIVEDHLTYGKKQLARARFQSGKSGPGVKRFADTPHWLGELANCRNDWNRPKTVTIIHKTRARPPHASIPISSRCLLHYSVSIRPAWRLQDIERVDFISPRKESL